MVEKKNPDLLVLKTALTLAARPEVDRLMLVSDHLLQFKELRPRSLLRKLIIATSSEVNAHLAGEQGAAVILLPTFPMPRMDRIKLAMAHAQSSAMIGPDERVLVAASSGDDHPPDMLMLPGKNRTEQDRGAISTLAGTGVVQPDVLESVIDLAVQIGYEGFEANAVGALFVLGDSVAVMEKSRQLSLNPFQGYSEAEKNVLHPAVAEAVKRYAVLDGAFVIRSDGVVMAACRYLYSSPEARIDLPVGYGSRHTAAACISATTRAIAVVVSQTTGSVRVFHEGRIALDIHQGARRF
ncbi:MAG: hypothetical protein GMKNLPBB_01463 [Myxococcota bacterium]|nr:hypothetical protein [Myxococcota bacterium]